MYQDAILGRQVVEFLSIRDIKKLLDYTELICFVESKNDEELRTGRIIPSESEFPIDMIPYIKTQSLSELVTRGCLLSDEHGWSIEDMLQLQSIVESEEAKDYFLEQLNHLKVMQKHALRKALESGDFKNKLNALFAIADVHPDQTGEDIHQSSDANLLKLLFKDES